MSLQDRIDENTEEYEAILEGRREQVEIAKSAKHNNPYNRFNFKVEHQNLGAADSYRVTNRAGRHTYTTGYPEVAIQEGLNSLANRRTRDYEQYKVEMPSREYHSIGASLELESYTFLTVMGRVTLANNVDDDMIKNKATSDDHITIRGGRWDANRANQASGHGVDFRGLVGDIAYCMDFDTFYMSNVQEHGIHFDYCWASTWYDVSCKNTTEDSFNLYSFVDSKINRIGCSKDSGTTDVGFYLEGGSCNSISNMYLGGTTGSGEQAQLYNNGCDNTQWNNIRVDNMAAHGVELAGTTIQNIFCGLHITTSSYPADNAKDALRLDGNSNYNMFSGFYIGKKAGGAIDWRNGVNELAADWNTYACGIIRNCDTATTTGMGGNSVVDGSVIEI